MLFSEELVKDIPDLYDTENLKDPLCHIKLFSPDSNWSWFITEFSKGDKDTCFGYVQGLESELGYFSLRELESLKGPLGLPIERDLSFKPASLSKIKESAHESR